MEYTDLMKNFGIKLKYYRLMNNLTQEVLAERIKVDSHYISDIERGRRNISFKTLNKLASALEISEAKLFSFDK